MPSQIVVDCSQATDNNVIILLREAGGRCHRLRDRCAVCACVSDCVWGGVGDGGGGAVFSEFWVNLAQVYQFSTRILRGAHCCFTKKGQSRMIKRMHTLSTKSMLRVPSVMEHESTL